MTQPERPDESAPDRLWTNGPDRDRVTTWARVAAGPRGARPAPLGHPRRAKQEMLERENAAAGDAWH